MSHKQLPNMKSTLSLNDILLVLYCEIYLNVRVGRQDDVLIITLYGLMALIVSINSTGLATNCWRLEPQYISVCCSLNEQLLLHVVWGFIDTYLD